MRGVPGERHPLPAKVCALRVADGKATRRCRAQLQHLPSSRPNGQRWPTGAFSGVLASAASDHKSVPPLSVTATQLRVGVHRGSPLGSGSAYVNLFRGGAGVNCVGCARPCSTNMAGLVFAAACHAPRIQQVPITYAHRVHDLPLSSFYGQAHVSLVFAPHLPDSQPLRHHIETRGERERERCGYQIFGAAASSRARSADVFADRVAHQVAGDVECPIKQHSVVPPSPSTRPSEPPHQPLQMAASYSHPSMHAQFRGMASPCCACAGGVCLIFVSSCSGVFNVRRVLGSIRAR